MSMSSVFGRRERILPPTEVCCDGAKNRTRKQTHRWKPWICSPYWEYLVETFWREFDIRGLEYLKIRVLDMLCIPEVWERGIVLWTVGAVFCKIPRSCRGFPPTCAKISCQKPWYRHESRDWPHLPWWLREIRKFAVRRGFIVEITWKYRLIYNLEHLLFAYLWCLRKPWRDSAQPF